MFRIATRYKACLKFTEWLFLESCFQGVWDSVQAWIFQRANLLNADWLRQRAFFLIRTSLVIKRAWLLAPDWPSNKNTCSCLAELTVSTFNWPFEKFRIRNFLTAVAWKVWLLTWVVWLRRHRNRVISWKGIPKGESQVPYAKQQAIIWIGYALGGFMFGGWRNSFMAVKFLDFLLYITASCNLKKGTNSSLRRTVSVLFSGWMNEFKFSEINCSERFWLESLFALLVDARFSSHINLATLEQVRTFPCFEF